MIRRLHNGPECYGVEELCEAFNVSRSSYYAHLRKPEGARRQEDEVLRERVAEVFAKSRETCGTPRLRAALHQSGAAVSRERIARLMKEAGWRRARSAPSFRAPL